MERQRTETGRSTRSTNNDMMPFEIEMDESEERELLLEASDEINPVEKKKIFGGRNAGGMRRRGGVTDNYSCDGNSAVGATLSSTMIQGFLRTDILSHAVYHLRNALMLGLLAVFVLLLLEWEGSILRSEVMEAEQPSSPHTFKFGGSFNLGHNLDPDRKRTPLTTSEEANLEAEILSEALLNVGSWDVALENGLNEQAHYLHDPEKSPFASDLYLADDDELDERQNAFASRMDEVKKNFGVWNNPNFEGAYGLNDDFYDYYDYRDVPVEDFPMSAWQMDQDYILNFLDEAQSLVEAVKEGIMEEYHHPNPDDEEKEIFGVIIGDHDFVNGTATHKETKERLVGIAYLPEQAWDGLIRKLLHAIITSDYFYVVVAGGDDAYKANNFAQTQVMQLNYIMEPVFHKLGVTLIARNMGMNASTAVSALGGADVYGESDILWHVQRMDDEQAPGEFDLLQKQSIMAGERVPIVLSPYWDELIPASKGKAWVGNIQPGADMCEATTMEVLPEAPACHNVHCDEDAWISGHCYVYDSVCWEVRKDWNPNQQDDNAGDQDKGYPGFRRHQLEGRKMTLLLLHAINASLDKWRKSLAEDRNPLPLAPDLWHVGTAYEDIRKAIMSLERTPGEVAGIPACEILLKNVDPRICHVPMHAFTEWTPRVVPGRSSLLSIINNLVVHESNEELYEGPDIVPFSWRVPEDQIDVHMIAIAANVTPGYDDDLFGGIYLGGDDFSWDDDGAAARKLEGENDFRITRNQQDQALGSKGRHMVRSAQNQILHRTTSGVDQQTVLQSETRFAKHEAKQNTTSTAFFTGQYLQIVEGSGWRLLGSPVGFCDGSAQSRCNRTIDNQCLLANHNHYKGSVVGRPQNSWLTLRVPQVKHGIILAHLELSRRPEDLLFDYAVNGVARSLTKPELDNALNKVVNDTELFAFLNIFDAVLKGESSGISFEIAMRIRSESNPGVTLSLHHIYFA